MTCEAAFMGGPADGRIQAFPGDEPPSTVVMHVAPSLPWHQWDPDLGAFVTDDPVELRQPLTVEAFTYRRKVSALDNGPLWVFIPSDAPSP